MASVATGDSARTLLSKTWLLLFSLGVSMFGVDARDVSSSSSEPYFDRLGLLGWTRRAARDAALEELCELLSTKL